MLLYDPDQPLQTSLFKPPNPSIMLCIMLAAPSPPAGQSHQ